MTITPNEYQDFVESVNLYPRETSNLTLTLGLAGEAGEIANKMKKVARDGYVLEISDLRAELGDVLWYVAALAADYDIDLQDVLEYNMEKLKSRKDRGTLQGNGDNR